jgi:hypothetical protein
MSLHRAASLRLCAAIFTVVGSSALVACGSDPHSSGRGGGSASESRDLGQVSAALQAVGPDGATYSLNGESLVVTLVGSDAGSTQLDFTQGLTSQAFSLPPGSYTAGLQGAMSGKYPLTRAGDGGATSVTATITDPLPYAFTITAGATTPLTFHFAIQSLGTVTFSTGTLNTNLAVANADGGSPTSATIQSTVQLAQVTPLQPNGSVPNAGIRSMITASGSLPASFAFNTSFTITGPFVAGIDNTCAPIQTPFVQMPVSNVNSLWDEATNGAGTLCFYDSNGWIPVGFNWGQPVASPVPNAVVLTMTRTGTPQTPAGMMATSASATWTDIMAFTPSTPIYSGTTVSFSQLQTATTMSLLDTYMGFDVGGSDQVVTQGPNNGMGSTLTFTLSP